MELVWPSHIAVLLDLAGAVVGIFFACLAENLSRHVRFACVVGLAIDSFFTVLYCNHPTNPSLQYAFKVGKALGAGAAVIVALAAIFPSRSDIKLFECACNWISRKVTTVSNRIQTMLRRKNYEQLASPRHE